MINKEHKLTIDDLIVEYMICKIENNYEPNILASEFMDFLHYFEEKKEVEDVIYDGRELFERFLERKIKSNWNRTIDYSTMEQIPVPHVEIKSSNENDYLIKPNYEFSHFDRSVINTYFMPKKEVESIRDIILEYLKDKPKRKIDMSVEVNENKLNIGKLIASEIIINIWDSYVKENIKKHIWPSQCTDINKYLLEKDLAEIIEVKSIKKELLELYEVISKRIAVLYSMDNKLEISSYDNGYLAHANYKLLIQDYEELIKIAFKPYGSSIEINLEKYSLKKIIPIQGFYDYYDDVDKKTINDKVGNANAKKLVKSIDKEINK